MYTQLTEEEIQFCKDTAQKRLDFNKNNKDIPDYDTNRFNLSSLQANFLGIIVEVALCKFLEVDYTDPEVYCAYSEDKKDFKKPDVLGVFEARRANKVYSPLPVRKKDVEAKSIIVQGFAPYIQLEPTKPGEKGKITNYGKVMWTGWMDAEDAWRVGVVPDWAKNGNSKTVDQSNINTDMTELWIHYKEHHTA